MKSILFICKTSYQIVIASVISIHEYNNAAVDIILCDSISNVETLRNEVVKSGIFRNVLTMGVMQYKYKGFKSRYMSFIKKVDVTINNIYDRIYISNIHDWVLNQIVRTLREEAEACSRHCSISLFEDGFSTYSNHNGRFFSMIKKHRIIFRRVFSEYYKVSDIRVFSPELMQWKPDCEVKAIKKISCRDTALIDKLNCIFGYKTMEDCYDKDIIFFEESYFADGYNVKDDEIIDRLVDELGRDRLFVKIHPRNPVNRFRGMGIKTNQNTEIPWEIIALNIDLSEKTLITIASGSALTSLMNTSISPKRIVMLMNCKEIPDKLLTPSLEIIRKVATLCEDNVLLPDSMSEFYNYIDKELKN